MKWNALLSLSGEKETESKEDLLQYNTDGSAAFDALFIGINFYGCEGSAKGVEMKKVGRKK